jgi:acetyltransferase-like isoleucine patch superfamily enzyme
MYFISKIVRYVSRQFESLLYRQRIVKIKLLYPGVSIDFKTKIEKGCSIICVDGGRLVIKNSHISFGTLIKADCNSILSINNTFIGRNCVIVAKEKITIEKNCLIAEMVVIRDQDHALDPASRNSFVTVPIEIQENVWIGSRATILKGTRIGKNSVIAASAVVTNEIPSNELWAGIPAYQLKKLSGETCLKSSA